MSLRELGLALLLALGTWLLPTQALADAPRVVLLRDAVAADVVLDEALTRLRSELLVAGFAVTEVASGEATSAAAQEQATVTFSIRRAPPGNDVEIWVTDRLTGKSVVRRIALSGKPSENAASLLAIRAAELLRASLLEATVEPKPTPAAPPPRPKAVSPTLERFVGPVEAKQQRGLLERPHFLLGVSGLFSFAGLGPSLAPTLRAGVGLFGPVSVRLSLTGPTLTPELSSAAGEAALRQELGLVELVYGFGGKDARFVPLLALGGGVYHVAVHGSARAPFEGHQLSSWSVVASAGLGGALRLGRHAALLLDTQALLAEPAPSVSLDGQRAGALGRPVLLTSFGLVAAL